MFNSVTLPDLSNLSKKLNLLYYEYDKYQNSFLVDSRYARETTYSDLIKLTYELSKHNIGFFKDERSNIVISSSRNLFAPLKQRVKNIYHDIKSFKKNIYVLSDKKVKYAKNLPMIQTVGIHSDMDLTQYDALIFTSKNGVRHCDTLFSTVWKKIPAYAISKDTAKAIKDLKGKLAFTGREKHGDEFAYELLDHLKGKKVAYLGAETIVSNLMNILHSNHIQCDHLPIYKTVCSEDEKKVALPSGSIIIFSSPSTIHCFFKKVEWDRSFTAISIGRSTAKYFPDYVTPILADTPSLESCVCKALSL